MYALQTYKNVIVFSITDLMWLSILHPLLEKNVKKSLNLSIRRELQLVFY